MYVHKGHSHEGYALRDTAMRCTLMRYTPTECNELLNAAQSTSKWEQALINVSATPKTVLE
jgi:hypothetical protein